MELHLLLGVVNPLIKTLCDLLPKAKEWTSSLHIPIQPFHGGHFNGNDCMKLLRGVSKLQLLSEKENFAQAHGFIQTLTQGCCDFLLWPEFGSSLRIQNCSIPTKLH